MPWINFVRGNLCLHSNSASESPKILFWLSTAINDGAPTVLELYLFYSAYSEEIKLAWCYPKFLPFSFSLRLFLSATVCSSSLAGAVALIISTKFDGKTPTRPRSLPIRSRTNNLAYTGAQNNNDTLANCNKVEHVKI